MARAVSLIGFVLLVFALVSFGWWISSSEFSTSGSVVSGLSATGFAIKGGELEGLELSVEVPEMYQNVEAGNDVQFQIGIKNLLKAGRHDIQLDYFVKKNEIVVNKRRELKAIETQASFLSSINIPEETLPGIYDLLVEINEEESAGASFYVKSNEIGQIRTYLIILIVAIVVVGSLIFWELHKITKRRR